MACNTVKADAASQLHCRWLDSIIDARNDLDAYLLAGAKSLPPICARKVQRYFDLKTKFEPPETKELGTDAAFQPLRSQNLRLAYPGEIPHEPNFIGFHIKRYA